MKNASSVLQIIVAGEGSTLIGKIGPHLERKRIGKVDANTFRTLIKRRPNMYVFNIRILEGNLPGNSII